MPPPSANEQVEIDILIYDPNIDLKYRDGDVDSDLWTSGTFSSELPLLDVLMEFMNLPMATVQEVFLRAYAVSVDNMSDRKTGAFRMSLTMRRVYANEKLKAIISETPQFGGILIVTKEHSAAFEESYKECKKKDEECKERDKGPLSKISSVDRAIIEQHHLVPYAEVAFRRRHKHDYTQQSLTENWIHFWMGETLPAFVEGKIKQLQAKRQWQDVPPEGIFTFQTFFTRRQLNFNEFVTVEQPVLSFPNAPPVYNCSTFLDNDNIPLWLEETMLLTAPPQTQNELQNFEASGREMLNEVGKWASSLSRYVDIPKSWKGGPASWPDKMGILTLQPLTTDAKLHTLRHVCPQSDWAVFDGVPVVLVELDTATNTKTPSTAKTTQSSASTMHSHAKAKQCEMPEDKKLKNITLDMAWGLAYAAVIVRSTNIALKTNNYCLPYIWVSKLWHALCFVVYQSGADIVAYPLQYTSQNYFDLTDQHAKAHFQLQLLNIVDSRMRSLSEAQAKTVLNVWVQCRLGVGDLVGEDLSNNDLDEDGEDDLPKAKRWKQMAPSSHDVYVFHKAGRCYVRKNLIQSAVKELAVYQSLLQVQDHPDIKYFIYTWSTGCWDDGSPFLELPYYLPVGEELRKTQGGLLHGQSLLLCDQLLSAVHFLHSVVDVAHMDIKPDNLVLDMDRDRDSITLKVIDFNNSIIGTSHDVQSGERGTTGYMAPEVEGHEWYSPILADLYSCGICMGEFLKMDQKGRRDQESNDDLLFNASKDFAARLCNQSPSARPSLTEWPKVKECLTGPQRDLNMMSLGRVVG